MKELTVCGYCYASLKDSITMRIKANMKEQERCAFCKRLTYGYLVEVGDEDHERRPANYSKTLS